MLFPRDFKDKKILIFGYGKTGKSVEKYFIKNNINYTIWDDNLKISTKKIDNNYFLKKYDFIILSPGTNIYNHEKKIFFKRHKKNIITE